MLDISMKSKFLICKIFYIQYIDVTNNNVKFKNITGKKSVITIV